MKKSVLILVSLLLVATVMSFAGAMPKIAEKQTITFHQPMLLGGTELPAGTYTVKHEMNGDEHIMIFNQADVNKNKAIQVKVKCNLVPLTEKAKRTETRYVQNAKNQNVLSEITFQGDEAKHVFEGSAL
ncbi:hypothetical protein Acid345_2699 [Candidatus Koribacter versatilis Ellin345]|uniref:Uncharacterized protein n=1 Tax=Koribacter versatilis (strain Ellin345) TaxID=204669 RepID=Q1IN50_KORVE|nr:DUF2911 domain-containing protein [Candidatus Koribacter versatilis]ABF41700.1 hypothetical protein Acid345_2699 [Candidatus Koribacter versatilis Ellin345]